MKANPIGLSRPKRRYTASSKRSGFKSSDPLFIRDEQEIRTVTVRFISLDPRNNFLVKPHRTERALDGGESSPFSNSFLASSFVCSRALSMSAPPVMQTVKWRSPQ